MGQDAPSAQPPVTVAGIIRVSTKSQGEGQSPENQRQVLAAAGATVFFEAVESGYKSRRRDSLEPLFDAIRQRRITKLLATDLSRAARSDKLLDELIALCDEHGVDFLAGGLSISHESAYQWFSAKQMQLQAELYSRDLSGRIRRGQAACVARGKFGFTSAHLPWHLQKDPNDPQRIIPRPECWDDARTAVLGYISGQPMLQLCAEVYAKHGVLRLPSSLNKWLKSGWLRGHYASRDTGEILIANITTPLITEQEHELVLLRLAQNIKRKGTRAPHQKHALSGLCRCVACGKVMSYSVRQQYRYLRCQQPGCTSYMCNAREELLEAEIREQLDLIDLAEVERASQQRKSAAKPSRELLNLRLQAKKLKEALAIIDNAAVAEELRKTQQRIADLEDAHQPDTQRLTLKQLREVGSEAWWSQREPVQRNLDYLTILEEVGVAAEKGHTTVQYIRLKGAEEIEAEQ